MMKLCLDMNNCHLTEKTFNGLNSDRKSYAQRYPEDLFLPVPDHSMADLETYPDDLRKLFTYVWESNSICIEFSNGSDALTEENGYTLEECLRMEDAKFFLD